MRSLRFGAPNYVRALRESREGKKERWGAGSAGRDRIQIVKLFPLSVGYIARTRRYKGKRWRAGKRIIQDPGAHYDCLTLHLDCFIFHLCHDKWHWSMRSLSGLVGISVTGFKRSRFWSGFTHGHALGEMRKADCAMAGKRAGSSRNSSGHVAAASCAAVLSGHLKCFGFSWKESFQFYPTGLSLLSRRSDLQGRQRHPRQQERR